MLCIVSITAREMHDNSGPLLISVIMVKDEGHIGKVEPIVVETLRPMLEGGIDAFFVFDTGSTDNTIEVTEKFFVENNIQHWAIAQEPFVDFATSRNRAFELCEERFPNGVFMIMPDAEWYLQGTNLLLEFCEHERNSSINSYSVRILNKYSDFYQTRLVRCNTNQRFGGKRHEAIIQEVPAKAPDDVYFFWNPGQTGWEKSQKRWERDLVDLLQELADNPASSRSAFYLADTYHSLGRLEEAAEAYKHRISLDQYGWNEENYMARYRLGRVYEAMNKPLDAIDWYQQAYTYRPHRVEPLVKIAQLYWNLGNQALSYVYINRAVELPYPDDVLFLEPHAYNYERHEIMCKAAYYMPDAVAFHKGEKSLDEALKAEPGMPHLYRNKAFYVERRMNDPKLNGQ